MRDPLIAVAVSLNASGVCVGLGVRVFFGGFRVLVAVGVVDPTVAVGDAVRLGVAVRVPLCAVAVCSRSRCCCSAAFARARSVSSIAATCCSFVPRGTTICRVGRGVFVRVGDGVVVSDGVIVGVGVCVALQFPGS